VNRERIDGVKLLVNDDENAQLEKNKQLIAYWVLLKALEDGKKVGPGGLVVEEAVEGEKGAVPAGELNDEMAI